MGANIAKYDSSSLFGSVVSIQPQTSGQTSPLNRSLSNSRNQKSRKETITTDENGFETPDVFGSQWDDSMSSGCYTTNMATDHVTRTFSDDNDVTEQLDHVLRELDNNIESFSTECVMAPRNTHRYDKTTLPPLRGWFNLRHTVIYLLKIFKKMYYGSLSTYPTF